MRVAMWTLLPDAPSDDSVGLVLVETGPGTLAAYDDPLAPRFLRRTEVFVPVEVNDG